MNSIVREFHQMDCFRVSNYARYVFRNEDTEIEFGNRMITITELCKQFPNTPARSVQISAWCGPPTQFKYRCLTLSELMQDWYLNCIAHQCSDLIDDCERALDVPLEVAG